MKATTLTKRLLATLEADDSFEATKNAITKFIHALDCDMSHGVLGDGDIAEIYKQYLSRRGKSVGIGAMMLKATA